MRSLAPSMRKPGSFVAALCVAALAVACQEQPTTDPLEGFVCTASVEPAIVVRLVDGETGMEGLPGFALMAPQFGTVRDGGYVDSLRLSSFSEDTLHSVVHYAARAALCLIAIATGLAIGG